MESASPQVIYNKRSFLATLALGVSSILAILVLCLAGIFIYGMNIADRKTDNLLDFVGEIARQVPQLKESLPPILSDAISDERRVSYQSELEVGVKVALVRPESGEIQPVIEIKNGGDQVVSFLSMRIVLLDPDGLPLAEINEWAATPIADGGNSWRGPLFPGSKRLFRARSYHLRDQRWLVFDPDDPDGVRLNGIRGEVEITELRVWSPDRLRERRAAVLPSPQAAEAEVVAATEF